MFEVFIERDVVSLEDQVDGFDVADSASCGTFAVDSSPVVSPYEVFEDQAIVIEGGLAVHIGDRVSEAIEADCAFGES